MATTEITQELRLLELKTPLGANTLLINTLEASEEISGLFQFQLDMLADVDTKIQARSLLGKAVCISMLDNDNGDDKRYFHGIVSHVSQGPREERFQHYHAVVVPWLWLLTLNHQSRIFQDKTVVEIVKAVFDDLKSSFPDINYRDATTADHTALDYCVQYRETDFHFVSRLMEQDGIFYFFEHTDSKHTLVLADSNSVFTPCPGNSTVLYFEGGFGEREGTINYWEQQISFRSGKFSMRDHHFQLPTKSLEVMESSKDQSASASLEVYKYPGQYALRFKNPEQRLGQVEKEGDKLVRIHMEEEEMQARILSGGSTRRNLRVGNKFSLSKHFSADGQYLLTSVHHTVAQTPDYISGQTNPTPYRNSFGCVAADVPVRPARSTIKPVIAGPQTATVAVKSGEESWLDKFGRVRVQFHWERKGKNNETSACWVRVAQPWAGASWGAHFWPRVGQEVVVEFLEGDPDRPIITGSVYNAANMPPYTLPDNYTRSGIITRSSKNGGSKNFNELRFEDKTGQEQIFINAEKDMDHRVEHDHRVFIGANQHLIVKANQTELIEGNKDEHVKGVHVEKIDSNASRDIGGDHKEKIAGKLSLQVGGAQHHTVGSVYTLQAGDEIHLMAGSKVVIEGGMEVSIKGAGGFVDIGASGVTIQGTLVTINSGGSAASGTSASPDAPDAPKDPDVADDGSKGTKLN